MHTCLGSCHKHHLSWRGTSSDVRTTSSEVEDIYFLLCYRPSPPMVLGMLMLRIQSLVNTGAGYFLFRPRISNDTIVSPSANTHGIATGERESVSTLDDSTLKRLVTQVPWRLFSQRPSSSYSSLRQRQRGYIFPSEQQSCMSHPDNGHCFVDFLTAHI